MKKIIFFLLLCNQSYSQGYLDWTDYKIENFYKKVELPTGSINKDGDELDVIYIPVDPPENGTYSVVISSDEGDMFEVKETDYYIKFSFYRSYISYGGQEGVLDVSGYYNSYFYENPD